MRDLAHRLGVSGRVVWTGMLTGALKWGAFHAAEAFVLPSHQENFGIAVAEALACGVPVLVSDKVNIWREIAEDRSGFVEPDTLEGTRRLLERWLAVPLEERNVLRETARRCFAARFEISRAAASLTQTLENVLQARRAARS